MNDILGKSPESENHVVNLGKKLPLKQQSKECHSTTIVLMVLKLSKEIRTTSLFVILLELTWHIGFNMWVVV